MASTPSHLLPSSVLKWSLDDVCTWFTLLSLTNDYTTKLKELLIDGQVLAYSDSSSLISISSSHDRNTFSLAHKKILKSVLPFYQVPFQNQHQVPFQSQSSTSSPNSANSFSSSLTSPSSVSPIKSVSPESFLFPVLSNNERQCKSKLCLKSKSLDELLNTTGDTVLTTPTNQSSHLFDMLRSENVLLKKELEYYYERVSRLQKLDLELQQLQDSYRLLEGTSQRKAKLEKSMRERIEEELLRMKVTQTHIKDELYSIKRTSNSKHYQNATWLKERETTIEKLSQENEQAIALRQKLENSLKFTKSALEQNNNHKEKRNSEPTPMGATGSFCSEDRKTTPHELLDQTNDKKRSSSSHSVTEVYISNLEVLHSLLTSMQVSSDNRQRLEQQLRKQLENKVKELEAGQSNNNKGKAKNDQQIMIATLQADLAQMEQKYAELLAEKHLSINDTRQSQLSLLEDNKIEQEEELKAAQSQRDRYMKQLEQANQTIMEQEKRIHILESLHTDIPPSHTNGYCYTTPPATTAHSHNYQPTRPIITTPHSLPVATPTLPSYDEHVRYTSGSHHHIPSPGSRSFPNTPETVRRRLTPKPVTPVDNNTLLCLSSPAGCLQVAMATSRMGKHAVQLGGIHKSLTPPPQHRPLLNNGHTPLMTNILASDRSPSLSPPSRYQIGRNCHSFGSTLTYDSLTHK